MAPRRPRFSIVSAVWNVAPYLPDFIESIEAQRFELEDVEIIAVDDGSTDESRAILEAWRDRTRASLTILSQPNAGQGAARNLGLAQATGEWVTFTDPDDMIAPGFLLVADKFARAHPNIEVMASRPMIYDDERRIARNTHPRRHQYERGNRVIDLEREPTVFTGGSTVALFRLDRVRRLGLDYDERLRPAFEDGHFAARFILGLPHPLIGVLRGAKYLYRKRAAGTSTMQAVWQHPGRYTATFEHGYLDLVRRSRRPDGSIPPWVQHLLIYDFQWFLREHDAPASRVDLPPELADTFHDSLAALFAALDPQEIRRHDVMPLRPVWTDLLVHAYRGRWHPDSVERTRVDARMRLQRVRYRYTGDAPIERVTLDGRDISPAWAKRVDHRYFGRVLLHERVLWLPDDPGIALGLDGVPVPIVPAARPQATPPQRAATASPRRRRSRLRSRLRPVRRLVSGRAFREWRAANPTALADARLRLLARIDGRLRFRDAWVLIDRVHDADDNAERLFEHLRRERRDINAWFVVEEGTPDWHRLRAAGTRRIVAHGSTTWKRLMLNAAWLISSHSDAAITLPAEVLRLAGGQTWKLGFLQHGVIKDDLAMWLNNHDHDLFVVSTEPEYRSVAGDGSAYLVTPKEVRLTGLPRFDRLLSKARDVPPERMDLVIVAPTWRSSLARPLRRGSQRRELHDAFWQSEYVQRWTALLAAPEIEEAVRRRGWRLGFMPHPNLQHVLEDLELPRHVEPLSFHGTDVQGLHAHTGLLVTDYSSVVFNTAYLDRAAVYYQFDRDQMLVGGHVGRPGYFDYERDGFGPVTLEHDAAVAAIVESIERGPIAPEPYLGRIAATFPVRDGRACARVVAAIEELNRPWEPAPPRQGPTRERG